LRAFTSISIAVIIDIVLFFPCFLSRQPSIKIAIIEAVVNGVFRIGCEILLLPLFWLLVAYVEHKERENFTTVLPACAEQFSSSHYLKES
jgi:hypothetical protein